MAPSSRAPRPTSVGVLSALLLATPAFSAVHRIKMTKTSDEEFGEMKLAQYMSQHPEPNMMWDSFEKMTEHLQDGQEMDNMAEAHTKWGREIAMKMDHGQHHRGGHEDGVREAAMEFEGAAKHHRGEDHRHEEGGRGEHHRHEGEGRGEHHRHEEEGPTTLMEWMSPHRKQHGRPSHKEGDMPGSLRGRFGLQNEEDLLQAEARHEKYLYEQVP